MPVIDSIKQNRPYLIGVAGGSGSGKTFFANKLKEFLGPDNCSLVYQDSFYFDQSKKFDHDGGSVNFDHPDAIDSGLLAKVLLELKSCQQALMPIYDFKTHSRLSSTEAIHPRPLVLVDGILIFHYPEVRDILDERIFFDTSEELRFLRRLDRDVRERGRSPEGVKAQFYRQVKPMHDTYVEPSKLHAHTVVGEGEFSRVFLSVSERLSSLIVKL